MGIRSGHVESRPGAFPDFSSWRTLANFSWEKSPEIYLSGGVEIFQSSKTSCITSLAYSRSFVLYISFCTYCEAFKLAEMGQERCWCLVLLVKLLIAYHDSRLECMNSMELTAFDQRSFRFSSNLEARRMLLFELPHHVLPEKNPI